MSEGSTWSKRLISAITLNNIYRSDKNLTESIIPEKLVRPEPLYSFLNSHINGVLLVQLLVLDLENCVIGVLELVVEEVLVQVLLDQLIDL